MNLGEFHEEVKMTVARGSALDTYIPSMTRRAVRWLERNYGFQYMKRFGELKVNHLANQPRAIQFPFAQFLKKIEFFRQRVDQVDGSTSCFHYLTGVDPVEVGNYGRCRPQRYWMDGLRFIWLDSVPTEDLIYEIYAQVFTDWPKGLSSEHWLLSNAEDALLAQTMIYMASPMRDQEIALAWKPQRDEALHTLLGADDDLQSQPMSMQFASDVLGDEDSRWLERGR